MPAFASFAEAQAELIATADYDVSYDVDKAKRFAAAARALITFASISGRDGTTMQYDMAQLSNLMNQALRWIESNSTPSDAQRAANPAVTHADFSNFHDYGDNWPPGNRNDF